MQILVLVYELAVSAFFHHLSMQGLLRLADDLLFLVLQDASVECYKMDEIETKLGMLNIKFYRHQPDHRHK